MHKWEREARGREILKQVPHSVQSPMWGSIPQPWDHDLSLNQESDTQPTKRPRHLDFYLLKRACQIHLRHAGLIKVKRACYSTSESLWYEFLREFYMGCRDSQPYLATEFIFQENHKGNCSCRTHFEKHGTKRLLFSLHLSFAITGCNHNTPKIRQQGIKGKIWFEALRFPSPTANTAISLSHFIFIYLFF